MRYLVGTLGVILIAVVLWETFETIVLPRRVIRRWRVTGFLYHLTWSPWAALARSINKTGAGKRSSHSLAPSL